MRWNYHLNFPSRITYSDGRVINYVYSASGAKLKVSHKQSGIGITTTTDYVKGYIFTNNSLSMALTDNGYYTLSRTGDPTYYFYLKDHQGNNRVVVSQSGSVEQINHYYPYGALFAESTNGDVQRFKYNGKELDRKFGLNWYDHGARHNDAAIGRGPSIDKNAEKYYGISPYAYCGGDPVNLGDYDGMEWDYTINEDGSVHITLDVDLEVKANLTESQIEAYKSAINDAFNTTLSYVLGGNYSGTVTFNGNKVDGQLTPVLTIGGLDDPVQGGQTIAFYSRINIFDSNGDYRNITEVAFDAAHELFHTARLAHPFETTQATDVELIRYGASYFTTPNTDVYMLYNVMNYPTTVINGQSYRSSGANMPQRLTKGQVQFLLKEIDLQKNGAGTTINDPYWTNIPGIPVN